MGRVILISNRLPVSLRKNSKPEWGFFPSSGGLITALQSLSKRSDCLWVGWPGAEVPDEEHGIIAQQLLNSFKAVPVFLPSECMDQYYNGFSNSTLWPVLHYLPGEMSFSDVNWQAYLQANQMFADAVLTLNPGEDDIIWIHDYHLFLLPQILKDRMIRSQVGFFLHTPFPSYELFRMLPVAGTVLHSLLGADVVGFHSFDYVRHFEDACKRTLGEQYYLERKMGCTITAIPIGINANNFLQGPEEENVQARLSELESELRGKKVILGIDRLDYIKGIPNKLAAFMRFLEKYPEHSKNTVLLQIAVPTRQEIQGYTDLRQLVYMTAGRCNAIHGSSDYSPCQVTYNSIPFEELSSLYRLADICLITSLRDGMNLVAFEYIASQRRSPGTLIISEFAGASQCLSEAITVNPWDSDDIAEKINASLSMEIEERRARNQSLLSYVMQHQCQDWANSFTNLLHETRRFTIRPGRSYLFILDEYAEKIMKQLEIASTGHLFYLLSQSKCSQISANPENGEIDIPVSIRHPGSTLKAEGSDLVWKFNFGDYDMWESVAEEMIFTLRSGEDYEHFQVIKENYQVEMHYQASRDPLLCDIISAGNPDDVFLVARDGGEIKNRYIPNIGRPVRFLGLPEETTTAEQRMKEILAGIW